MVRVYILKRIIGMVSILAYFRYYMLLTLLVAVNVVLGLVGLSPVVRVHHIMYPLMFLLNFAVPGITMVMLIFLDTSDTGRCLRLMIPIGLCAQMAAYCLEPSLEGISRHPSSTGYVLYVVGFSTLVYAFFFCITVLQFERNKVIDKIAKFTSYCGSNSVMGMMIIIMIIKPIQMFLIHHVPFLQTYSWITMVVPVLPLFGVLALLSKLQVRCNIQYTDFDIVALQRGMQRIN